MAYLRRGLLALTAAVALLLAGCDGGGAGQQAQSTQQSTQVPTQVPTSAGGATAGADARSPSLYTLSPLPMPTQPPPTGMLRASMRQSSRDTLLNRFEVWVDNDTDASIRPTRVSYRDARFRSALPATRLRDVPSQSERGFPIYQPSLPACAASDTTQPTVTVTYRSASGTRTVEVAVEDETDVAGRYASSRCLELAVREVARLSFADSVPQDPPGGQGADGHLTLLARTSGRGGHTLTVDTVTGTPVLSPVGTDAWRPGVTVSGDQPDQRIDLPVQPTRCDAHAFAESGGATTFLVGIHLDGVAGQLKILMSPRGSKHAIDFALTSCGLLTTVDGGTAGG